MTMPLTMPVTMPHTEMLVSMAGTALVTALWQGFVLAASVGVCLRFVPRSTAAMRFAVWVAALLLICALPLVESGWAGPRHAPVLTIDGRWAMAAAVLWLALSLVRACELGWHASRLKALARSATVIEQDAVGAMKLRAGKRRVPLCTSERLERPGVIGFLAPRILVPRWLYEQTTAAELEQIVLHELEHLRRGDDWLNLLQKIALVVFPLNPVLHWIDRRLCLERELACDEGVVRRTRAPRLYASCLARLAEHGLDHRAVSLALGAMERQSQLARRVAGILRSPRTLSARANVALTGALAMLLLGGSVELVRCPRLVSFTTAAPMVAAGASIVPPVPGAWARGRSARPMIYTDAVAPRLVRAALLRSLQPTRKKVKARTSPRRAPARRAALEEAPSPGILAADARPPATMPAPATPVLVRYTLVRVDGGWVLLQL